MEQPSGAELWRRNIRRSSIAMTGANVIAALFVFVYLMWVVPVPHVDDVAAATVINLAVFAVMLPIGVLMGRRVSLRNVAPTREWIVAEREPTPEERDYALGAPLRQLKILTGMWAAGAALFFAINVWISVGLAFEIAAVVLLGGLVTGALAYLLIERINREITERALSIGPPEQPAGPGVVTRLVLTWAVGTGVFLFGISALAVATLIDPSDDTLRRVAVSVLFLSVAGLVVGLLTVWFAARSVADPLGSVRSALAEVERGRIDVEVPVEDGSEVGLLQAGVNRMVAGLREHERLRDLFGRHVGEDVARARARARGRAGRRGARGGGPVRRRRRLDRARGVAAAGARWSPR